jgi:hypothetical protein
MNQPTLGQINRNIESNMLAKEFCELGRVLMLHQGDVRLAEKYVRDAGLPLIKGREILKAAVQSGSLTGTWGGELAPFA